MALLWFHTMIKYFFILFPLTIIFLIFIKVGIEVIKSKDDNKENVEKFEDNPFIAKCVLFLYFTYIVLFLPTVISLVYSQNDVLNSLLMFCELLSSGFILFYIIHKLDNKNG